MGELRQYYRSRLQWLTVFVGAYVLYMAEHALPWLKRTFEHWHWRWGVHHSRFLVSGAVIGVIFWALERAVRTWLWKHERRKLNIDGMWHGVTTYQQLHIGDAGPLPPPKEHDVRFAQDCLSLRLPRAGGRAYADWGAEAVDLDGDTVHYAYSVNYTDQTALGDSATGYEEMSVTRRLPDKPSGLPIEMRGRFYHCARPGAQKVYSGTVRFVRAEYERYVPADADVAEHPAEAVPHG